MNDGVTLVWAGLMGLLLGAIFFAGLWRTVHLGLASRHPALWFLGSLLLRMGIVLGGFYWLGHDRWEPLIPCLGGFVLARLVVIRLTRPVSCREAPTPCTGSFPRGGEGTS